MEMDLDQLGQIVRHALGRVDEIGRGLSVERLRGRFQTVMKTPAVELSNIVSHELTCEALEEDPQRVTALDR